MIDGTDSKAWSKGWGRLAGWLPLLLISAWSHGATVTVTANMDVDDAPMKDTIANLIAMPGTDGKISLREAIQAANNDTGDPSDTILFDGSLNNGVVLISSTLPAVTSAMTIDATGQNIELDADGVSSGGVLNLNAGAGGSSLRGLLILNASGTHAIGLTEVESPCELRGLTIVSNGGGILIAGNVGVSGGGHTIAGCKIGTDGSSSLGNANFGIKLANTSDNTIGGFDPADRNIISGNETGIVIDVDSNSKSASNNRIINNIIGMSEDGQTAIGNTTIGVKLFINGPADTDALNDTIIGTTDGGDGGNLISGNGMANIYVSGAQTTGTRIFANLIGTDIDGDTAVFVSSGAGIIIADGASGTQVGDGTEDNANVISGNDGRGIDISEANANIIKGNLIGVALDGETAVANGIGIEVNASTGNATGNIIGGTEGHGNVIAFNDSYGVQLFQVSGIVNSTTITYNEIFDNLNEGINFAFGTENNGISEPSVSMVISTSPYSVQGNIATNGASESDTIHLYADANNQGRYFLGEAVVGPLQNSFDIPVNLAPYDGMNVTATATDQDGNTSRFSVISGNSGISSIPPTAIIDVASDQRDPTNEANSDVPIEFEVLIDEPVQTVAPDGLTFDDIVNLGTAGALSGHLVTSDDKTFTLNITGVAMDGTVIPSIAAGTFKDLAGNFNGSASTNDTTDGEVLFDTVAPVITVDTILSMLQAPELTGTVNDTTATITVEVNGSGTLTATNNGNGTWTLPANSYADITTDGTYEVLATAKDAALNESSDSTSNELTIDTTTPAPLMSPVITADNTPPLNGTIDDNTADLLVDVAGQSEAAMIAGGTWTISDNMLSTISDGAYDVTLNVSDDAGNSDAVTVTNGLTVDTTVPSVTIDSVQSTSARPEFSGTVSDLTSTTLMVTVDAQTFSANVTGNDWTATPPSDLSDGVFDIQVDATDAVSNSNMEVLSQGAEIDTEPPTVTIDNLVTNDTTPPLSGTVDDGPISGRTDAVTISVSVGGNSYTADNLGGGAWQLADNVISPALAIGAHDVAITATDALGNVGMDATTDELFIDTSTPVVSVNDLISNLDMPVVSGTVSDGLSASVSVEVNSQLYTAIVSGNDWSATITNVLPEDTYTVTATATDAANNEGSGAGTLKIDRTAPEISVNPLITSSDAPVLTGLVSDENLDSVTIAVNNTNYTPEITDGIWEVSLPMLPPGAYEVVATATDLAENSASDMTSNELIIDQSAPVVTVDRVVSASAAPTLTGAVSDDQDGVTIEVIVDGVTYTPTIDSTMWSVVATDLLVEGHYTALATATDAAGNTAEAAHDVLVDLTDPVVTVNTLATANRTPTLTGSVVDLTLATVEVTVNEVTYSAEVSGQDWSAEILADPPLDDGIYDVVVSATDEALRTGTDETLDELTINGMAPVFTIEEQITNESSPILRGTVSGPFPIASMDVTVNGGSHAASIDGEDWHVAIAATLPEGGYDVTLRATDSNNVMSEQTFPDALVIDTTPPAVTVDMLSTNAAMPILTGTVSDANSTAVDVEVNGQIYAATVEDTVWHVIVEDTLDDGQYEVIASATDAAGNTSSDTTENELTVDSAAPVVSSFERSTSSPANSPNVDFTLIFSEEVSGVDVEDFAIIVDGEEQGAGGGKAIGGLPLSLSVNGGGDQYTLTATTGTGDGTLALQFINNESVSDGAGNLVSDAVFLSKTYVIDRTPPTLAFSSTAGDPTSASPIPVTVTFSEQVAGFDPEQISVTNAMVTEFGGDGVVYSAALTPLSDGLVTVNIGANAVEDLAGNFNMEGDSFVITYVMDGGVEGEGEGEGEGGDCLAQCTGNDVDRDGDGLDACVESCLGTRDTKIDSDGDGMPDNFEFEFGLDPTRDDASEDRDLDDESNLDEFLGNSDPTDPSSPNGPLYIAQDGVDEPDAGFSGRPWRTINYALSQITPDPARKQRILIRTGTYMEDVALLENVILAAERGNAVTILGQIIGAEGAALRRVTVMPAGDEPYLFDMNNVAMELLDVVFMGTPERDRTGMLVDGPRPANSLIDRCTFTSLGVGIDIGDGIPTIRRSTFGDIPLEFSDPPLPGAGIIIRDNSTKSAEFASKSIGDATDPNSGWNDFLLSIEGFAVINERAESLMMQSNYWGTIDPAEFEMRVDGPAVLEPVLAQSSAILASSVFCTVWDSSDQKRLVTASVQMRVTTFKSVTNNNDGIYAFPAIGEGDFSLVVEAPGYRRSTANLTVNPGEVKSISVAMTRQMDVDPPADDNGCPLMPDSKKSLADLQGDIFLGGLTILTMLASTTLFRRREN